MRELRIDIVHRFSTDPPSLKNLVQAVESANGDWDVNLVPVTRPNFYGQNKITKLCELSVLSMKTLTTVLKAWMNSDILIIHKPLHAELIEKLSGVCISEAAFVRAGKTIYSTYDGDYVEQPRKTSILFEKSDLIYATSRRIADFANMHSTEGLVVFVPPSVDTEFFHPNYSIPSELVSDSLVVGWIGDPDVHIENLQHFAEMLPSKYPTDMTVRLLLGGGSLPNDVSQQIREKNVELDLIDYVPKSEVPVIINSFDIGVAPLEDTEFNRARSSEKIREYMACGIPVIASNLGENPYLIPENAGFLVGEKQEWKDALLKLSDTETRAAMGLASRKFMIDNFSIPIVAGRIRSIVSSLMK